MDRVKHQAMSVDEWQKRLEDTFSVRGVIGHALLGIMNDEKLYGESIVDRFKGYDVLQNSFQGFFVETLRLSFQKANGTSKSSDNAIASTYHYILNQQVLNFRGLRAAENLLLCGYPMAGYSLLRDLKDRAIFMLALMKGLTAPDDLFGVDDEIKKMMSSVGDNEQKQLEMLGKAKNKRKAEERRIFEIIDGSKSGLSNSTQNKLKTWKDLFDSEVHGGKLSLAYYMKQLTKGSETRISPEPMDGQNKSIVLYINRSNEIGWMYHRTLPGLQLNSGAFGKEWADKWMVLDESFRVMINALGEMGKEIAYAIEELIDRKFLLNPDSHFCQKQP